MKNLFFFLFGIVLTLATTAFAYNEGFIDIKPSDWFYNAALEAQNTGVMQGVNGKFLPGNPVTRAELAVVLQRSDQQIIKPLRTWITPLLNGSHLFAYILMFPQVPWELDDPRELFKDSLHLEVAFTATGLTFYAERGWENNKFAEFFIYSPGGPEGDWYGGFQDDVKRLSQEVTDLGVE